MARILFVDDERDTLLTMQKAVGLFGHRALLAATGDEAIRLATEERPDLIFIDNNLPDMSGLAIIAQLRLNSAAACIPVVMLSASPELDIAGRARAAGVKDYLLKPVRLQTLLDIIQKYTPAAPPANAA